ncbi:MAG: hypothetical protein ACE5E6_09865 [Phycisphaerae bacterium]
MMCRSSNTRNDVSRLVVGNVAREQSDRPDEVPDELRKHGRILGERCGAPAHRKIGGEGQPSFGHRRIGGEGSAALARGHTSLCGFMPRSEPRPSGNGR